MLNAATIALFIRSSISRILFCITLIYKPSDLCSFMINVSKCVRKRFCLKRNISHIFSIYLLPGIRNRCTKFEVLLDHFKRFLIYAFSLICCRFWIITSMLSSKVGRFSPLLLDEIASWGGVCKFTSFL